MNILRDVLESINWKVVLSVLFIVLLWVGNIVYQDYNSNKILIENRNDPFKTDQRSDFHFQAIVSKIEDQSAKEYRLDAYGQSDPCGIDTGDYGCANDVYVSRVHWPDGGDTTFDNCSITQLGTGNGAECTASNGDHTTYNVELIDYWK